MDADLGRRERAANDLGGLRRGETLEVAARVSAVAANRGASSDAEYSHGVAIFTMTKGGLMAEASVGGQQFSYVPR